MKEFAFGSENRELLQTNNYNNSFCAIYHFTIILILNFRMTVHGETLNEFTHSSLQEPTHLAVDTKKNNIIVSDSVICSVLIFNIIGELLFIVSIYSFCEIICRL